MSIVCYIAGLACIILPEVSPLTLCISSGIVLIVYGLIKIVGYFSKDLYCLAFQYDFACGLLLIVLGIIVLVRNQRLVSYLSVGLGVLVLLDSLLSVQMSRDAKQFGLETWYVILITSVIAAVFSILLIVGPFHDRLASHIIAGCTLLAAGLKSHCVVFYTVKTMKCHMPEKDK